MTSFCIPRPFTITCSPAATTTLRCLPRNLGQIASIKKQTNCKIFSPRDSSHLSTIRNHQMMAYYTDSQMYSSPSLLNPRAVQCQTPRRATDSIVSRLTGCGAAPARQAAASQLLSLQPNLKSSPHQTRNSVPTRRVMRTDVIFV